MFESKLAVMEAKVMSRIQKNVPDIESVIAKIQDEGNLINDFIVPTEKLCFESDEKFVKSKFGQTEYSFTDFSLRQMAEKSGIPQGYVGKLNELSWGKSLIAHIFNEHNSNNQPSKYLFREVNGQVRGVLSDRYKRLNSLLIFTSFLQACFSSGAKLYSGLHTDSKSFLEVVHPSLVEIETENNGVLHIAMGARIRNSDFGDGALDLKVFMLNAVCLNGMVGEKLLREVHIGERISGLNELLSVTTIQKETEAQAAIVSDVMSSIFSEEKRNREIQRIIGATKSLVDMEKTVQELPKLGVLQSEMKSLTNKLMGNNPDDGVTGKNTIWKLVQGLTSVANEQEPARCRELQDIASKLY